MDGYIHEIHEADVNDEEIVLRVVLKLHDDDELREIEKLEIILEIGINILNDEADTFDSDDEVLE